jgi:hypothetical protein
MRLVFDIGVWQTGRVLWIDRARREFDKIQIQVDIDQQRRGIPLRRAIVRRKSWQ